MNFTQMHEQLRLELLRRIRRGTLSVSLLARQTGYGESHLSNFLHCQRRLSLAAMDRILAAQHLTTSDLIAGSAMASAVIGGTTTSIPIVSAVVAMNEPFVRPTAIQALVQVPSPLLQLLHVHPSAQRRAYQRFVAVNVPEPEAEAMSPIVQPGATVVIDRHYATLDRYRADRPNLYAVRNGPHLQLRYLDWQLNRLILQAHNHSYPIELLDVKAGKTPGDFVVGRVVLILNEM